MWMMVQRTALCIQRGNCTGRMIGYDTFPSAAILAKEAGIYAGLQAAKGDYVATLDADLQDPPSLLPDMLDTLLTGEYDCAATRRTTREGEPPIRSWFAHKFYQIINKMSDTEIVDGARDFRLMSRKMVVPC